jgi:ribosome biogenesis ATPase
MNKPRGGGGNHNRLSRSLEHKVNNVIDLYKGEGHTDFGVFAIYEYAQKVDASLRRIKKRQLEVVIEKITEASAEPEK